MEYKLKNGYSTKIEVNKYMSNISIYDTIGLLVIKFYLSNEFMLGIFDKIENALNEAERIFFKIPNVYCYYSNIFIFLEYYDSENIMIGIKVKDMTLTGNIFCDFGIISNEEDVTNFFGNLEIDFLKELETLIPRDY